MIVLPPKDSNAGCEVRLLLAECRSPAYKVFALADAKLSMQYMDKVIFNRLEDPKPYGAAGAKINGMPMAARYHSKSFATLYGQRCLAYCTKTMSSFHRQPGNLTPGSRDVHISTECRNKFAPTPSK